MIGPVRRRRLNPCGGRRFDQGLECGQYSPYGLGLVLYIGGNCLVHRPFIWRRILLGGQFGVHSVIAGSIPATRLSIHMSIYTIDGLGFETRKYRLD